MTPRPVAGPNYDCKIRGRGRMNTLESRPPVGLTVSSHRSARLRVWCALIALSAVLLSFGPSRQAVAQVGVTHTWVAKVDEHWITHHDVEQRAKLLRFERRAPNLAKARKMAREELIDEARRITGHAIPARTADRRAGDPATLVSGGKLAQSVLGWVPKRSDLATILGDAWRWHAAHPDGYGDD